MSGGVVAGAGLCRMSGVLLYGRIGRTPLHHGDRHAMAERLNSNKANGGMTPFDAGREVPSYPSHQATAYTEILGLLQRAE